MYSLLCTHYLAAVVCSLHVWESFPGVRLNVVQGPRSILNFVPVRFGRVLR